MSIQWSKAVSVRIGTGISDAIRGPGKDSKLSTIVGQPSMARVTTKQNDYAVWRLAANYPPDCQRRIYRCCAGSVRFGIGFSSILGRRPQLGKRTQRWLRWPTIDGIYRSE